MKNENKLVGAGLLTAFAASLCCITPVLALVAGTSGVASSFAWLEPFRPYLIAFTILVIGFAWYQMLKPSKMEADCDCDPVKKPKFTQTRAFLAIVTVFAAIMLAFPYFSDKLTSSQQPPAEVTPNSEVQRIEFEVHGMSCTGCENNVIKAVSQLPGIFETTASFEESLASIQFDANLVNKDQISAAIAESGYDVIKSNPE